MKHVKNQYGQEWKILCERRVKAQVPGLLLIDVSGVLQEPNGTKDRKSKHILLNLLKVFLAFPLLPNMVMDGFLENTENSLLLFFMTIICWLLKSPM